MDFKFYITYYIQSRKGNNLIQQVNEVSNWGKKQTNFEHRIFYINFLLELIVQEARSDKWEWQQWPKSEN